MSLAWNRQLPAARIGDRAVCADEDHMSTARHPALSQRALLSYGQPVSDLMARALANPRLISLAAGFVDQQTLPCEETGQALQALFAETSAAGCALQYGTTAGYPPLREAILQRTWASDGTTGQHEFGIERVVLTAGSNELLHLVAETLLDPGDIVLCGSPTYFVFLGTLRNLGAVTVGLASDEEGILPEALEGQLRQLELEGSLDRVKAVYLVSYFDNPRGITLPAERRAEIVEICRRWSIRHKIYVIDDMAYRQLRYRGPDHPSFLYYDPSKSSPSLSRASQIASGLGVEVATSGQLAYYASAGGTTGWYGITSTGDVLSTPGPTYSPSNYVVAAPCAQMPYGVWLYGPKPPVGAQNVSPFNCSGWFQPAPKGS